MAEDRVVELSAGGKMTLNDSDPRVPSKPKKGGKKPPKPPAPTKKKRVLTKPPRTLAAALREMGPDHVAAADILGADFKAELRKAMRAQDEYTVAEKDLSAAEAAKWEAQNKVNAACNALAAAKETIQALNDLAATIKAKRPAPRAPQETPLFYGLQPGEQGYVGPEATGTAVTGT